MFPPARAVPGEARSSAASRATDVILDVPPLQGAVVPNLGGSAHVPITGTIGTCTDYSAPDLTAGDYTVSINELCELLAKIADWPVTVKHVDGPLGVRGRNSDNTLARGVLKDWRPQVGLVEGLTQTYQWIEQQVIHRAVLQTYGRLNPNRQVRSARLRRTRFPLRLSS